MEGPQEMRRSLTLSDHMSAAADDGPNPSHFRGLVSLHGDGGRSVTLGSAIASERREAFAAGASGRTLMDIIREEQAGSAGRGPAVDAAAAGVNWKAFKDRLRLRRADEGSSSSGGGVEGGGGGDMVISLPTSPVLGRSMSSVRSGEANPLQRAVSRREAEHASSTAAEEEEPVRMSLMALLEQTDRQGGGGFVEEEEAAEEEEEEDRGGGMYHVCCVCMVRHKGAAFIPCGHTFCRLCSRELWVSRGNCPLCNGYILEILDIF